MPIKNLKALFPDQFGLVGWSAPGSLSDGSREEEIDSVSLFSETTAFPLVLTGWLTVPKSSEACSVTVIPPPGSKTGTSEKNSLYQYVMARPDELVMLRAVSKLKNSAVFAWSNGLQHTKSPVAVVRPFGEYSPALCTRQGYERLKLNLVDILLEQIQGGRALASNSYWHGGRYASSLRLARGEPASFTACVSPESEFVRWEFYRRDDSQPFLVVDKMRADMHWTQAATAVARVVTRPKDEYKLLLETKVADPDDPDNPDTPGHDCPGYVVVENARTIGTISYHGPKRYYPKDGWVRLRPVANPGYRFVKWETDKDAIGATPPFWMKPMQTTHLNECEKPEVAVLLDKQAIQVTAVFEPHISLQFGLKEEQTYKDVDPPDLRNIQRILVSDSPDVYIGALAEDTIWFRVPEMEECGESVTWGGAATGTGWRTSVTFEEDAEGDFEVSATVNDAVVSAKLKVFKRPQESLYHYSASHPAVAAAALYYQSRCRLWAHEWQMGGGFNNGRSNACQHAYWSALIALYHGSRAAIDLTTAYEYQGLDKHLSNAVVMDLLNNAVGAAKGDALATLYGGLLLDDYIVRNSVIAALNDGGLWMLTSESDNPLAFLIRTDEIKGANIPSEAEPRISLEPAFWQEDPGPVHIVPPRGD
ncbi:MAG: DUF6973 domain-containing protein [Candidatus Hydrogenedentales bacterium]